jgi:hypothetical protein
MQFKTQSWANNLGEKAHEGIDMRKNDVVLAKPATTDDFYAASLLTLEEK